jgi:uncharacterized protein
MDHIMHMKRMIAVVLAGVTLAAVGYAASEVADAAMNKDKDAIRSLLAKKADVNATQADGTTALHWAVRQDDLAAADVLIRAGANVKAANREGATPLYLACVNANVAMMDKLLKAGEDVNSTFLAQGETPLMVAARSGNVEAVRLLLDRGAQVNAKETLRGTTAVMWAAEQDHPAVVKLLAEHGADVNAQSIINEAKKRYGVNYAQGENNHTGGVTALVLAAREGALASVQALFEAKADLDKP